MLVSEQDCCKAEGVELQVQGNLLWIELSHDKYSHGCAGEAPPGHLQDKDKVLTYINLYNRGPWQHDNRPAPVLPCTCNTLAKVHDRTDTSQN